MHQNHLVAVPLFPPSSGPWPEILIQQVCGAAQEFISLTNTGDADTAQI